MDLTIGQWIWICIVALVMGRLSSKISLKTIFKPTKKIAKKVEQDWEES